MGTDLIPLQQFDVLSKWNVFLSVLLFMCFQSFWWGARSFFKADKSAKNKTYWTFRVLSFYVWTYSIIFIIFQISITSITLWILAILISLLSLVIFWTNIYYISATKSKNNAQLGFSIVNSKIKPSGIFKQGLYSKIRHPFYTSYILCYLACIILSAENMMLTVPCLILIGFYFYQAKVEEKNILKSELAEDYLVYQKNTGMFFPKLFSKKTRPPSNFQIQRR